MSAPRLKWRTLHGIDEVDAVQWNAIAPDYPFLRHEFLHALEATGCVAPATGWTPQHLLAFDGPTLVAAAPLYLKTHSWGEFVFDFAWARAWESRGLSYYPKLLAAIPFTPATGPRLLLHAGYDAASLRDELLQAIARETQHLHCSTAHALFIDEAARESMARNDWLLRSDCHFQWHNRGYRDFEDFLAGFAADKRKKARRERRRVAEQDIEFITVPGPALESHLLRQVYDFHASTFARHGHLPYLTLPCFELLARTMGPAMLVKLAMQRGSPVAAAVFFRSSTTLYGRYWGAAADFHSLHFEACYHQGVDYCIEQQLQHFEPGTQGEHKLARGFEPTLTWSAHWIGEPGLRAALATYLQREQHAVSDYAAAAAQHLPFRAP